MQSLWRKPAGPFLNSGSVCFSVLLSACICTTQTDTGGLPGDFKALSLWRLQIHCSKICIPQRFYNPFRMIEDLHISVRKLTQTLLKSFVLASTVHTVKVSWHITTLHQHSVLLWNLTETQTWCCLPLGWHRYFNLFSCFHSHSYFKCKRVWCFIVER